MIKISAEHKQEARSILEGWRVENFNATLSAITPILESYCTIQPSELGKRLLVSLFSNWLKQEEESIVHYWTICRLIDNYGFPIDHIDHEVSCGGLGRQANATGDTRADLVVYAHPSRTPQNALITIECRQYNGVDGARQAASYARALQSPYHLFTDSSVWSAFETQPHPVDGLAVSDIPHWIGSSPLQQRLSKSHQLPPITDEEHLRNLIKMCHDQIHGEGVDPAKAFDELVKLFFVKLYDEQEVPDDYQFAILSGETESVVGQNIRALLREAKRQSRYKDLFTEPGDEEFGIEDKSIAKVVETFQGFSFTASSRIGIDAKGTVYEQMVGSTFRGELGQYFTPRKIVQFMIDLMEPSRDDRILDPSCGSGGFLIGAMRAIATQIREQQQNLPDHHIERLIRETVVENIRGADLSPRMVRASRMNMIMHGDGWACIQRGHGLKLDGADIFEGDVGKFSLILSNPPFAGYESDDAILTSFETGHGQKGNVRAVNKAIIFVEQIIRLLDEGGRAGIVLPRSIFENESHSFKKIRDIIFETCEILAIVGLPRSAFFHTDCGILGDLLFIRKVTRPRDDYDVFVAWANEVGYNTLGHNIQDNDFPMILDDYRNDRNSVPISVLKADHNINPWHYHPDAEQIRKNVEDNRSRTLPLTNLVSIYENKISKSVLRQTPDRLVKYLEVRKVDPLTGHLDPVDKRTGELPSRATYELDGRELILLPNARHSLESSRQIVKIGDETQGIIMNNRFLPLIPRVNADYLVMALNTPFVRNQLIAACRGAGSPDLRIDKLSQIMIPVPDSTDLSSIDVFMDSLTEMLAQKELLEKEINEVSTEIEARVESLSDPSDSSC